MPSIVALLFLGVAFSAVASEGELSTQSPLPSVARHELWISRPYEGGVENRVLFNYFGRFDLHPRFGLDAGASASVIQHSGLSLLGIAAVAFFDDRNLEASLGYQHERWSGWQVSENRVTALGAYHFPHGFYVTIGASIRVPRFQSTTLAHAFEIQLKDNEFTLLYRVDWRFVSSERFRVGFLLWNFDRMRQYTSEFLHAGFYVEYMFKPGWRAMGSINGAVKGVSGMVMSFDQSLTSIGVSYEP